MATKEEFDDTILALAKTYVVAMGAIPDDKDFRAKLLILIRNMAISMQKEGLQPPDSIKPFLLKGN